MAYIDMEVDTDILVTPQPLLSTLRAMDKLQPGQVLKITTYTADSVNNLMKLCQQMGYSLLEAVDWGDEFTLLVKKLLRH